MRTLVRSPFALRAPLAALSLAVLAACSSTGSRASSEPHSISVRLNGYSPEPFELVSESRTSAVELYSKEQKSAATKVQSDDVMARLVDHLDDLGFETYARPGHAPATASQGLAKSIEVDADGRVEWWPLMQSAGVDELKAFQTSMRDFVELYNASQSWQSVDNTLGGDYFDQKKAGH